MARFKLIEKKRNRQNAIFHVIDAQNSTVCGSISVRLQDSADLLKCMWKDVFKLLAPPAE